MYDKYIKEFGADPNKTVLLNMVVDKYRFDNLPISEPSNIISYCGIISEYKDGVSILIQAFAKVVKLHPEYKLRLIGPFKNKEVENNLFKIVEDEGIKESVEFYGVVSPDEMPKILKSSKILALARPNNKQAKFGFATKIGEYLMTERPAVLTKVGTIEDYLKDQESCLLAAPDDIDSFAEKLLWAIENYPLASKIGERGKEMALRYFDSEKEVNKIINLIFNA